MRIAVLTVSDAVAAGTRDDRSGAAVVAWARARGDEVVAHDVVADESLDIVRCLLRWCDADAADVVITTGGTGFSARDVTPEATRAVLERAPRRLEQEAVLRVHALGFARVLDRLERRSAIRRTGPADDTHRRGGRSHGCGRGRFAVLAGFEDARGQRLAVG